MDANKDTQTAETGVRREYKDSVFRALLSSDTKLLLEAYNAISGTRYGADTKVNISTLTNVLCRGLRNDLAFELDDKLVVLIEHQSTLNRNMPLRMLLYVVEMYRRSLEKNAIYRREPIALLRPEFAVLYNGAEEMKEDCLILRMSDLYISRDEEKMNITPQDNRLGWLDLEVPMYNINKGHNVAMLSQSPTLDGYSTFVTKSHEYRDAGMSRKDAVGQAIDYCIENNYIRTYLEDHKPEVVTMLDTEWDFDTAIAVAEEEGMERGVAKGRMEGKVEGILQTAKKMKDDGLSIDAIQKYTGLTVDDIIRL